MFLNPQGINVSEIEKLLKRRTKIVCNKVEKCIQNFFPEFSKQELKPLNINVSQL